MSEYIEHLVDLFAAIIIIFIFPLLYFGQKQDALVQTIISVDTESLISDIRSKGYLTKEMYDIYTEGLSRTGILYEVTFKHKQMINEPEYRFRTEDEVIDEQNSAYTGSNVLTQLPVSTDIPVVIDPVSIGSLNTETNASVLAGAVNTPASPSHVHTDACYLGTKHTHTGNSTSGGGCYGSYVSGSNCNLSVSYFMTTSDSFQFTCNNTPGCTGFCNGNWVDEIYICGNGHSNRRNVYWFWICNKCGVYYFRPQDGVPSSCSYSNPHYDLNCGKTAGAYYYGNTQVFPCCNQLVSTITPTHSVQTVAIGDPLITTVTATYADGSTKIVIGITTFSTATVKQNQTATITYSYTLNGFPYTKTCIITVTVIPKSKTCPNSHTYNLNLNGTDPGCPYCHAWLSSLVITYPTTGSITIYKGTTLSENGVTLLATYIDGHTQTLNNEYIDNLDIEYVGKQNVDLSYKGKYLTLTVITKRNLKLCSVCSRYYELYPDGSDPGCPFCQALTPIFTGNVMNYYNENSIDEILKEIYEGSGVYYFTDKDYLTVSISNVRKSWGRRLLEVFFRGLSDNGIQVVSGGYIREDGGKK